MRRAAAVFVAGGFWLALVVLAGAAWAHPGIEDPYVPARVVTTVALGVPSEQPSPMVEIDVTLPSGFTLRHVDPVPGWRETTTPEQLRYFDGNVPQGGYAQFTFSGVFARKQVVEVPVITRAADGTTVDWDQAPTSARPAAIMFPGYPTGAAPVPGVVLSGSTTNSGWEPLIVAGALVLVGAGVAFGVTVSRRRHGARFGGRRGARPGPGVGPRVGRALIGGPGGVTDPPSGDLSSAPEE